MTKEGCKNTLMDKTLQQLVGVAVNGSIEQRSAALLVLAALKAQNSEALKAVAAALDHANPVLKDYALRYLEEIPIKSCVPLLLRSEERRVGKECSSR